MRGVGTDVTPLARLAALIDRHGDRFVDRCFRPGERERWRAAGDVAVLAECWAAKEAFVKAVGRRGPAVPYRDVEVDFADAAAPRLVLHGRAAEALAAAQAGACRLSLTHDARSALAVVVLA